MANICKCTKNGKTYYRMRIPKGWETNKDGKVVQKQTEFTGTTRKEVEQKYKDYIKMEELNLESPKQSFGIMADEWIYNFLIHDDSLKQSTIALYIGSWNKYVKPSDLYPMPLDKITPKVIQKFYYKLKKNDCPISAIKSINKTMNRFYGYLVMNRYVPSNFINQLSIPKESKEEEKKITTWSDGELSSILKGFEKAQNGFRLRFLLVMATYTGLRISELLGLKYDDIKRTPDGYEVSVRRQVQRIVHYYEDGSKETIIEADTLKSPSSYRTIPLNPIIIHEYNLHKKWHLEEQMRTGYRTDFIFTTDSGKLIDKRNAEISVKRYYKIIGVEPKGFHTYRHTFGTNLYKRGVPMKTASDLLGHSDISITAKYYIGTDKEEKRKAIELLSNIV